MRLLKWIKNFFIRLFYPLLHKLPDSTDQALVISEITSTAIDLEKNSHKHKKRPVDGAKWNPLLKYPRNESCYCGSNLKFKKCCLRLETQAISHDYANEAKALVKVVRGK